MQGAIALACLICDPRPRQRVSPSCTSLEPCNACRKFAAKHKLDLSTPTFAVLVTSICCLRGRVIFDPLEPGQRKGFESMQTEVCREAARRQCLVLSLSRMPHCVRYLIIHPDGTIEWRCENGGALSCTLTVVQVCQASLSADKHKLILHAGASLCPHVRRLLLQCPHICIYSSARAGCTAARCCSSMLAAGTSWCHVCRGG